MAPVCLLVVCKQTLTVGMVLVFGMNYVPVVVATLMVVDLSRS